MNYGTAAGFTVYHEARGREVDASWTDPVIEAALLAASEWIDGVYGPSFVGHKTDGFTQEREWPRINAQVKSTGYWGEYYVFPDDEIPERVDNATYEAAWRELSTPGSLQVDYTPSKYKKVSVDGAVSVEYAPFSSSTEVQTQINIVETILWPLLDPNSGGSKSNFSGSTSRT